MADITDFDIGQGESFEVFAKIYQETSGSVPLDLTDYTFQGQIRETYSSNVIAATFQIHTGIPEEGELFIRLTPEQTATFDQRRYVYDILMTGPSGSNAHTRRLLEGRVGVRPAATRGS